MWAAAAALIATVPALVYAYELIGSIKEITALPLILALGALVAVHPRWLRGPTARRDPVRPRGRRRASRRSGRPSAPGRWCAVLVSRGRRDRRASRPRAGTLGDWLLSDSGAIVLLVGSWPTWHHVSGSVQVAQAVASSANSRQPHVAPADHPGLRLLVAGELPAAPEGQQPGDHRRPDRRDRPGRAAGRGAHDAHPPVRARRLARADGRRWSRADARRRNVGRRQDPRPHFARRHRALPGAASLPCAAPWRRAVASRDSSRGCSPWSSRAGSWGPISFSTTTPISPRPPATTSLPR